MTDKLIAFNGKTFTTKAAVTDHLRAYVRSLPLRTWLTPEDHRFRTLLEAIVQHPTWGTRIPEIIALRVERERGAGLALVAKLADATIDKIGWTRCFTSPRTPYSRVIAALRYEIAPQIGHFRRLVSRGHIPQVSAISGTPLILSGEGRFHVDHTPAFQDTVEAWAPRWGGIDAIEVHDLLGGGTEITDDEIADDWWDFHAERHNRNHGLRAITREENLLLGRHHGEAA